MDWKDIADSLCLTPTATCMLSCLSLTVKCAQIWSTGVAAGDRI